MTSIRTRGAPLSVERRSSRAWRVLRIGTGALFVGAGIAKLMAPAFTAVAVGAGQSRAVGLIAGLFELSGGALLIAGWQTQAIAMALSAFVVIAATSLHLSIGLAGPLALELAFDAGVLVALVALFAHRERRV